MGVNDGQDSAAAAPLVSIVTPSYNQADFLEEAIRSVLDQDYPSLEYIVVDGGSTDGSAEIIRRYADRLAWWTSESDSGQVEALEKGFARTRGEILGWLNSDDVLLPGAVAAVVEALESDPDVLLVYGDNVLIDQDSERIGYLPARAFDVPEMVRTCQNHVVQPGSLFRRSALELAPLKRDGYYYFDFEWAVELSLVAKAKQIGGALAAYRLHPESKSMSAPVRKALDHLRVYETLFARVDLPPEIRAVEAEAMSRAHLVAAEYFYQGLEQRRARACALRGLRLYPRHVSRPSVSLLARTFLPAGAVRRLRALRDR